MTGRACEHHNVEIAYKDSGGRPLVKVGLRCLDCKQEAWLP